MNTIITNLGCQNSTVTGDGYFLDLQAHLQSRVSESSGLVLIDDRLWTLNDSGNDAIIYQINPGNGRVVKQLKIANAENVDWEDMGRDDEYLYIADTGNNDKKRTRAQIYLIPIANLDTKENQIYATQVLDFDYDKKKAPNCEAIAIDENRILLFSKNSKAESKIYALNKSQAIQQAEELGEIYSFGSVTGASGGNMSNQIFLTGYRKISDSLYKPFVWKIENTDSSPASWSMELYNFNISAQIEAVEWLDEQTFLLSSEKSGVLPGKLFKLKFQ